MTVASTFSKILVM